MSLTLYDKIWNDHLVDQQEDGERSEGVQIIEVESNKGVKIDD